MTAFFVATVTVKDPVKFQEYARKAGETVAPYGGETVLRGKAHSALVGSLDHHAVGIVKFPSQDALAGWYDSPEYQAIVPLRNEAADMSIITYSVPV